VVDEVCGYLVAMFLVPTSMVNIILGFFLFRCFDVLKPPPIRSLERLPGGFGIVADDLAAGIYSNIILQFITRLVG
jgi:phosphatidylglycerophosphatase A